MTERLLTAMIEYDRGDAPRIQHFIKVYEFARIIGKLEKLDEHTQLILESAAIVHDIGIHMAERKYGSSNGKYQEIEGPAEAEKLLKVLGLGSDVQESVSYLVLNYHTYRNMDGLDYQILVEADFLVNLYEDDISPAGQKHAYEKIFKTESGKLLCRTLYPAVCGL